MSDDRAPMQADTEMANADDPIIDEILAATAGGAVVAPDAIARRFADRRRKPGDAPDIWRKYLTAVRQQITNMARKGSLEILRKGQVIDPSEMKGLIKVRQPTTTSGT